MEKGVFLAGEIDLCFPNNLEGIINRFGFGFCFKLDHYV